MLGALLVSGPFWLTLAGDAQVHLAIAEQFAHGQPFRYNPGGELVVASTSPFWTLLLTLYFYLTGSAAPLLLKLTVVGVWLATAVLLYQIETKSPPSSFILHPFCCWRIPSLSPTPSAGWRMGWGRCNCSGSTG